MALAKRIEHLPCDDFPGGFSYYGIECDSCGQFDQEDYYNNKGITLIISEDKTLDFCCEYCLEIYEKKLVINL